MIVAMAIANNNHHLHDQYDEYEAEARYECLHRVSKGTFGIVYRAVDKKTGEIVGLKKEIQGFSNSTLTEISILESLPPHPSIVEFKDVFVDRTGSVYVVMGFCECDLKRYMDVLPRPFLVSEVKAIMKKILEGVRFLHDNGVMHRDLKPSNILIGKNSQVRICDFGLSQRSGGSHTPRAGTRVYKAPELLLGGHRYSSAVDMWAVGCILGELVLREILFKDDTLEGQITKIYEFLPRPSTEMRGRFAPLLTELGLDLLLKLLTFLPDKRITAKDALNHPWFTE